MAFDAWIKMNPAKPIAIQDIPGVVKIAFPAAVVPKNIQSGIDVNGIGYRTLSYLKKVFLFLQLRLIDFNNPKMQFRWP